MFDEGYNTHHIDSVIKIDDSPALAAITALIQSSAPGHFGVESGHWFKTITAKINLMRELENLIGNEIKVQSIELQSGANRALVTLLILAATLTALVLFAVYFIIQGI